MFGKKSSLILVGAFAVLSCDQSPENITIGATQNSVQSSTTRNSQFGKSGNDPMDIKVVCFAFGGNTCHLLLAGRISEDTPERVKKEIERQKGDSDNVQPYQILLNSNGGNIEAGFALGRLIRAEGLDTSIGEVTIFEDADVTSDEFHYSNIKEIGAGECSSACAYAFLGGVRRNIDDGGRLGFHRVSFGNGGDLPGSGGLSVGQLVSAEIISYLVEMNVDARIFVSASQTSSQSLFYPTPELLESFELVTTTDFGNFRLEPLDDGVVAVSEREAIPRYLDTAYLVHAYCKGDSVFLEVFSEHGNLADLNGEGFDRFVIDGLGVSEYELSIKDDRKGSRVLFQFPKSFSSKISAASTLEIGLSGPRVAGGDAIARIDLESAEHRFLSAAFRHCVSE